MTAVREVPAAPPQRRLWAIEQEMPGSTQHNLTLEVGHPGTLAPAAVRAALGDVLDRHEALRTDFRVKDHVLYQTVRAQPPVPLEYIDLTGQPGRDASTRYRALYQEYESTPFDLSAAPLLRIRQVRRAAAAAPGDAYDTLLLCVHHLVADATSLKIVSSDLSRACRARAAGSAPDWEPVPVQYPDYTQWLAERAQTPQARLDRDHWRRRLAGLEELDLTLGRPRPATLSDQGGAIPVALDHREVAAMTELAQAQRTSRFAVLLSAYCAALGRVFGAADVPVGMSVAGRALPDAARTVGLFTERLVLRVDVAGRPTFRQLVGRVREEVLTAFEHDSIGFDEIVRAAAPPRQYGVTPLAQASINLLHHAEAGADAVRDPAGAVRPLHADTVRHDIALVLAETGSVIEGVLEFRSAVLDETTARRVARVFRAVLDAGLRDPDTPVDAVAAVEPAELRRLHAGQDGGPARYPGRCLPALVAGWAMARPDALAVDAPDHKLTYRQLWGQVSDVAARLARRGVAPGSETPVIVAAPRCAAFPVCLLAVFAAGGVYVPVDPDAPPTFVAAVARAAGARLALVPPGSPATFPADVTALTVEVGQAAAEAAAGRGGHPEINPSSAAYVLFTSGSTGPPKGVTVEHRNLLAYTGAILGLLEPPPGAVHLMVQPATFDSAMTTVCGALASGGVLRLVGEHTARDAARLGELLASQPADYLKITPSHLAALLAGADPEALRPRRALILGGEAARRDLPDRLLASGWTVFGHYGPTETTVGVLAHQLQAAAGREADTVALGGPLPGVRVYLLDHAGNPVAPGCRGELYIAGALVARGYAGAPGLTAGLFRPDPFTAEPGARMYRTGDIARRLPDGTFEFCGRRDRQLKVRGHRVEPAAVERVLSSLPGVTEAAVAGRDGRLIGYVVTRPPRSDPARIRAEAARRLPAYQVPDLVIGVDALPLTAAGKLDASALPSPGRPEAQARGVDGGYLPPQTPAEKIIAELWCSVLGVPRVSLTDRFFDVGGDSIRAIYLVGAAAERGLQLTARDVFENPTVRGLAAAARPQEALPVRAVGGGLAGGAAPTVVWLANPGPGAQDAALTGTTPPPGWACHPGLDVTFRRDGIEIAADPLRCDDRTLCELAAAIVAAGAAGRPAGATARPEARPDLPAADTPAPAATAKAATAKAVAAVAPVRVPLPSQVAAALAGDPGDGRQVHDAYGTQPLHLAAAAVLHALAADPGGLDPAGPAAAAHDPAVLITEAYLPPPERNGARQALPVAISLANAPAGGWDDPRILLQATKAHIARAQRAAARWTAQALAGTTPVPGVVLRLLPLPGGATVVDAGTGTRDGQPASGRTVVLFAGPELLVVPSSATGRAQAGVLASRVADTLGRLVAHCRATTPVYTPDDFPDAGLDGSALARLLTRLGVPEAVSATEHQAGER
jgi:amino acid adenylation domain-containing protein